VIEYYNISVLKGLTLTSVKRRAVEEVIDFRAGDRLFTMFHDQDCCESVAIEDITGNLEDLVGSPITLAEESSEEDADAVESGTWTFYRLATAKGYVVIRWHGESNGYYSESVDFVEVK